MLTLTTKWVNPAPLLPSRFLQQLEWLMLAVCGSMAFFDAWKTQQFPLLHLLILILLAGMGWLIPTGKLWTKVLYTSIELSLIFFGTILGYLHVLPVLYLIIVIRSCFIFALPGRQITAAIALLCFVFHQIQYGLDIWLQIPAESLSTLWMHQIAELLMFSLGLALVLRLSSLLLSERQAQQELASTYAQLSETHQQLQQYALQVEQIAVLQERNLIAQEIHDALGHALTALNVQLMVVRQFWREEPENMDAAVEQAQTLGKLAMGEVRESVRMLRDGVPVMPPLNQAIWTLVETFQRATPSQIHFQQAKFPFASQPVTQAVYRVVQEALINVIKHAAATEVWITLNMTPQQLALTIQDNGRGFNPDRVTPGLGLKTLSDRATALKGQFRVNSQVGAGCVITLDLPLIDESHSDSSCDCKTLRSYPNWH
jgi:signal transduction histidine kinase